MNSTILDVESGITVDEFLTGDRELVSNVPELDLNSFKFSVDYLTVNVKCPSLEGFLVWFEDLFLKHNPNFVDWGMIKPKRFYRYSLGLNCKHFIRLEYSFFTDNDGNESDDMILLEEERTSSISHPKNHLSPSGLLLEISGDGLRFLGKGFVESFIFEVSQMWDTHYTRIDLAMDCFDPDNYIIPLIIQSCRNSFEYGTDCNCVITRLKDPHTEYHKDPYKRYASEDAYIGLRSGRYIRCYDKALEQRQRTYNSDKEAFDAIPNYWYRLEIQVRRSSRYEYCDTIVQSLLKGVSLKSIYVDFLSSSFYIAYVKKRYEKGSYLDPCVLWDSFLDDILENDYFVELTYLPFVEKKVNPKEVSRRNRRATITDLLSSPPDEIANFLYSTAFNICHRVNKSDIRYYDYLHDHFPTMDLSQPDIVYNHLLDKFKFIPVQEIDYSSCINVPDADLELFFIPDCNIY